MNYISTRNSNEKLSSAQAIARGLAKDGGLYLPEVLPKLSLDEIAHLGTLKYRDRAQRIMQLFLSDFSAGELGSYLEKAYSDNYDHEDIAPLYIMEDDTAFLELWHGPTSAFKDMALQMLPFLLTASLEKTGERREVCILVATSGDTGKAALEGFKDVPGTKILVFYPRDGVSNVQKLQMNTQQGDNVSVCAVEGNFDDAQTGVKMIFSDAKMAEILSEKGYFLSSANSINWGRLLPQIVYYFSAYGDYVNSGEIKFGDKINFCVPTGNFGNILAGWYAKEMGLPVNKFICASNENNVLTDFIKTGVYDKNREFYATISPSMDILVSSNLERLLYMLCRDDAKVRGMMDSLKSTGKYEVDAEILAKLNSDFASGCCSDAETKSHISKIFNANNYLMDTHTAVGHMVLEDYRKETGDNTPTVVVSTASPYKFADSVLDALGETLPEDDIEIIRLLEKKTGEAPPKPLMGIFDLPVRFSDCVAKEDLDKVVLDFLK